MPKLTKYIVPGFEEGLYSGRLTNGLTVYLQPRKGYHEVYGVVSIDFGAKDTTFFDQEKEVLRVYPAGIAHFLEHKMFELAGGEDVLTQFASLGANANAFTNLHQTSYLFSAFQEVEKSLLLLLSFLKQPQFTVDSIEKEKSIIVQEIQMYQDDPDARLYSEILASLYPKTPLEHDIAGTVKSVQDISYEMLMENFAYFYRPDKMVLFLTGPFDVESIWSLLLEHEKQSSPNQAVVRRESFDLQPVLGHRQISLEVASSKLAIGIRSQHHPVAGEYVFYKTCLTLLYSMLLGWTSSRYQELYHAGKIDSSFSFHVEIRPEYQYFVLTADTTEPIKLSSTLKKALLQFESDSSISVEQLELVKRDLYGEYIRSLNSLEVVATDFVSERYDGEMLFDFPSILEKIGLEDVLEAGRLFMENSEITDFMIFPK